MLPGAVDLLRRIQNGQDRFTAQVVQCSGEFAQLRAAGVIIEQPVGVWVTVSLDASRAEQILAAYQ
jgi:hypothetical protein